LNRKRLGDIVNFKRGYDLPERSRKLGPYPIISSSGISGYHNEFKRDGEGLITGRYGTLGQYFYVKGKYWPLNTALYATDFKGNYPKYVYFLLKSLGHQKTSDKSAVPGVNRNDLHEILIPYIEPDKQKPIADFLFQIEEKIELNNKINDELEAMAQAIYDYWFVQFDFPDENGKPYKSSGGKMVWNEKIKQKIPTGWKNGTLSDLGKIVGGSTPSKECSVNFSRNGIAWITPKDLSINAGKKFITKGEIDISEVGYQAASLKIMPRGTVLLSSRAPIGYMAIARSPVTTNQGFKSFVPQSGFTSQYIYYTVKNAIPIIINHSSGSTFKEVSGGVLKDISVCLPPVDCISKFTDFVDAIFEKQDKVELENETLTELRDWLLPMLMNGQINVK